MKKKITRKSSVSLDDLATMVADGFRDHSEQFNSRIDGLESRLDARVDGVEQKLGALHSEVLSMHYDHKTVKARLENVELRVFGSIQGA